jgi:hypothetical protein
LTREKYNIVHPLILFDFFVARKRGKCFTHSESFFITVTSSFREISTHQRGNMVVVRRGRVSEQIFKDDVNYFPPPWIFASSFKG